MTECRIVTSELPPVRRCSSLPSQPFSTPVASPTGTASFSGFEEDDEDDKENKVTMQERLLRSPTDKLLSPVSRALKAHKRSPKRRGVRTSLTSLLDAAT